MKRLRIGSLLFLIVLLQGCTGHVWRMRLVKAKASLRRIESAETTFKTNTGRYGTLMELASDGLIGGDLAKGVGDGYKFEVRVKDDSYAALAIPLKSMDESVPAYYLDQTGVLRQNLHSTEANANDERAPET